MTRKWRCGKCGSIHEGPEPPHLCPRCGEAGSRFVPVRGRIYRFFRDFCDTFVLHAVAAHFSNGLLPATVLFLLLALISGDPYFERTVLHLIVLALCVTPLSFFSGFRDWRTKFGGGRAPIFYRKMWLSGLLFLLEGSAAGIRLAYPEVLNHGGIFKWLYAGSLLGALPVVVLLGHYGGKLAFQWKKGGR